MLVRPSSKICPGKIEMTVSPVDRTMPNLVQLVANLLAPLEARLFEASGLDDCVELAVPEPFCVHTLAAMRGQSFCHKLRVTCNLSLEFLVIFQ